MAELSSRPSLFWAPQWMVYPDFVLVLKLLFRLGFSLLYLIILGVDIMMDL